MLDELEYLILATHYLLAAGCACYFILLRRGVVDLFSLAFLGSLIYALPAFLPADSFYVKNYFIYWMVIAGITATAVIFDNTRFSKLDVRQASRVSITTFLAWCALFAMALFIFTILNYGWVGLFRLDDEIDRPERLLYLYSTFVSLGACTAFLHKRRGYLILFLFFVIFRFLGGDRTQIAMVLFSFMLLAPYRVVDRKKGNGRGRALMVVSCAALIIIGIYGKSLYTAFLATLRTDVSIIEAFHEVQDARNRTNDILTNLKVSEPYHINSMLGSVVEDDFRVDESYLHRVLWQFLPFSSRFGSDLHLFSNAVKSRYYSGWRDRTGVGATFWGEAYANLRMAGVILFLLVFLLCLYVMNVLLRTSSTLLTPAIALMGAYLGLYIHRNSLFQIIGHEKRILYVLIFLLLLTWFVMQVRASLAVGAGRARARRSHIDPYGDLIKASSPHSGVRHRM